MHVDEKPFDDIRVRQAMVLAADNAQNLKLAHRGMGTVGENHHVGEMHPEYAKLPPLKRDVDKAKALLAEAGYADGLKVTCTSGHNAGPLEEDTEPWLKEQVEDAGIRSKKKERD